MGGEARALDDSQEMTDSGEDEVRLKIAISGCAGIGKSTLAAALAGEFRIELIPEMYEAIFERPGLFDGPPKEAALVIMQLLEEKRRLEREYGAFVTDRCPIDLFSMWLFKGLFVLPDENREFFGKCREYVLDYDFILFPPWGAFPMRQKPGQFQIRVLNLWIQLGAHATMLGLATSWLPQQRVMLLPATSEPPDEVAARAAGMIRSALAHRARQAADPPPETTFLQSRGDNA